MSTEREQLELAAKACGIECDRTGPFSRESGSGQRVGWMPHHDNGDCARMEAALNIDVSWHTEFVMAKDHFRNKEWYEFYKDHYGDKSAARRAASLAVAAEIGRLRAALGEKS